MASTHTLRTIQASASNTAGSTTTGAAVDLTTAYGGFITAKITNGGTGPTVACSAFLEVSGDNTNWKVIRQYTAGVANSTAYEWGIEVPPPVMYARIRFTGNTAQTVTVEAFLHELTTV